MDLKITEKDVLVPAAVPENARKEYVKNYMEITKGTGRLMLFAGDQKVEHMNNDFYGEGIAKDDAVPEHLFRIASGSEIGVFATQIGLVSSYGYDYPDVAYLIKLNSKTNLVKSIDPISGQWLSVNQIVEFKKNNPKLKVVAVGYTIYLGSEYEKDMLKEAANIVYEAHKNGLVVVIWIYPRGKGVPDEKDPHLIAGATGVAACIGADFVKVNWPKKEGADMPELFKEAVASGGRTKVVCAGGSSTDVRKFLQRLHDQIYISGAWGNATGRNIHQKPLKEAIAMCNAVSAITLHGKSVDEAMEEYEKDCK
jgi:fructose-bisphosphate aldolase / 6-deoxy-5-ketofructose 1-phosphate synthase